MTRASGLNGDELYAMKSFNVYFDTNLAHFKPITATKTMRLGEFWSERASWGGRAIPSAQRMPSMAMRAPWA